jgi:hypothetical protein
MTPRPKALEQLATYRSKREGKVKDNDPYAPSSEVWERLVRLLADDDVTLAYNYYGGIRVVFRHGKREVHLAIGARPSDSCLYCQEQTEETRASYDLVTHVTSDDLKRCIAWCKGGNEDADTTGC